MEKVINSKLLNWYRKNKRNLPWRQTQSNNLPDPYFVFVSEYMLQQTTVNTVKNRFIEFIQLWPNIESLAKISKSRILTHAFAVGCVAVAPPTRPTAIGISIVPFRFPSLVFSQVVKEE